MVDIVDFEVHELSAALQKGELSSQAVCQTFLKRSADNSKLNAFVELSQDNILAHAQLADEELKKGVKKPLLGVPIAVKDIILTKGTKTTCASEFLRDFVAPYDATVVRKLKDAGAIIFGKTNLDEFAMGSSNENSIFGPVENPWKAGYVPGGSSGGSAAVVAGRLAPASLGTDTGGSIRQPASYCNIVGLKPTYGRVSRYGVVAFASSLDQVGPFARTVKDCALLTQVLCGRDEYDSTSADMPVPDFTASLNKGVKGLRIGVPKEYFVDGMNPEVAQTVRTAIDKLASLGAEIKEVSLPHTEAALAVYYILAPAEASSNLARFDGIRYGHRAKDGKNLYDLYCNSRAQGFGAEVKRRIMVGTYVLSTGYYDAFYRKAQKVRALIAQDFTKVFAGQVDCIISPAAPTTAFKIGEKTTDPIAMYLNDIFTIPVNLAGLPGMSIPCGFDAAGLPIGLQLIGKPWGEETLFQVASAYEAANDWHKKQPAMGVK
jgi:aspartyl-tRNA(Asn)/glutamyl-tRNA(Gln) amidotransferase subunit A